MNHLTQTAAIDFSTVPTATFRVLFVFVVLSHERRRVLHFGVTEHPTQEWTMQQMREAFRQSLRHQMQCLAQYFRGQRSRYEPFRFDAVKKSLAEEGPLSLTLPSACWLPGTAAMDEDWKKRRPMQRLRLDGAIEEGLPRERKER
jgi:hypothetical protein